MENLSSEKVDVGIGDCLACGHKDVAIKKDNRDSLFGYFEEHSEPGSGEPCPQSEVLLGVCWFPQNFNQQDCLRQKEQSFFMFKSFYLAPFILFAKCDKIKVNKAKIDYNVVKSCFLFNISPASFKQNSELLKYKQ